MHLGRMVGGLIGILMLASILALPFSDVIKPGLPPNSLWNIFISYINNLGAAPTVQGTALVNFAFLYQVAAILLVIASLVGIYPIGSGVMGIIGLSFVTFGPYEVITDYGSNPTAFGSGFFLLWGASIVQLGVGYWTWRGERRMKRQKDKEELEKMNQRGQSAVPKEAKNQEKSSKAPRVVSVQIICPTCGAANLSSATVCVKCASPL